MLMLTESSAKRAKVSWVLGSWVLGLGPAAAANSSTAVIGGERRPVAATEPGRAAVAATEGQPYRSPVSRQLRS